MNRSLNTTLLRDVIPSLNLFIYSLIEINMTLFWYSVDCIQLQESYLSFLSVMLPGKVACEQGEEKERGGGRRELVGMAKDFDFQTTVIYVMFKLTIWVASRTTTTANFEQITKLGSWVNTFFRSIRSLSIHQIVH